MNEKELQRISQQAARVGVNVGTTAEAFRRVAEVSGRNVGRMRGVKCADCDEYRNEWCEKIIDSPYPDMIRDCQYWHKRKDLVEVIRCKDCRHCYVDGKNVRFNVCELDHNRVQSDEWYCADGERKEGEADD